VGTEYFAFLHSHGFKADVYTYYKLQFLIQVIAERREKRKQEAEMTNSEGRLAFLDLLLEMEQNGDINANDIQEEV
jgi:hypothetical protein